MEEFLTDVTTLRANARANMEKGSVTDAYGADLERVLYVLNQTLATELVCVLRYKRHYFTAKGINAQSAADEFLQHAGEEENHADMIAARITQLGECWRRFSRWRRSTLKICSTCWMDLRRPL